MCHTSIEGILRPTGSRRFTAQSLSVAQNWNHTIADILLPNPDLEWVFFMNDDHLYPADVLVRLLDHEVDFVTALYTERVIPFAPQLYDEVDAAGLLTRLSLPGSPVSGLTPIVACGDGALLVRRSVFELVDPPWWTYGSILPDNTDHDTSFCQRVREAGIPLYADLSLSVGHMTPITLTPEQQSDGSWLIKLYDRQNNSVEIQTVAPEGIPT